MPTIFDNIETPLLNELMATIGESHKADFCVGYFNLRGFAPFQNIIENWPPEQVRLLIGMYQSPSEELRAHLNNDEIDNPSREANGQRASFWPSRGWPARAASMAVAASGCRRKSPPPRASSKTSKAGSTRRRIRSMST